MSMSTCVIGFKPPDEKWKKMKAIWDACEKAGIVVPSEVEEYFAGEPPDKAGVKVDIPHDDYRDDYSEGIEIELKNISKDVKTIRFLNSW